MYMKCTFMTVIGDNVMMHVYLLKKNYMNDIPDWKK